MTSWVSEAKEMKTAGWWPDISWRWATKENAGMIGLTEKCRVKMSVLVKTSNSHCQKQLLVSFKIDGASEIMSFVTLSVSEISSLLLWCSSLSIIKVVVSFSLWTIFPFSPLDTLCSEMVLPASAVNLKSMTMEVILWNKWQCERYDVDHKNAHIVVRVQMSQILVNVERGSEQSHMISYVFLLIWSY